MSVTRTKILEAADHLFGTVGFDGATTRQIADRAGVNKALIHYHFRSKAGLLDALLDRYYAQLTRTLEEGLAGTGGLHEKLVGLVDAYLDFLVRNQNFSRIVQRELSGGRHVERVCVHMVPLFETGTRMLEEAYPGTRQGDLKAAQLLISFYGMIGSYVTFNALLEPLLGTDPLSSANLRLRKQHLHRMIEIVLERL